MGDTVVMGRPPGHAIMCACGVTHRLTPSALEVVLQEFIDGGAQRVNSLGVAPMCILELLRVLDHRKRKDRVKVA